MAKVKFLQCAYIPLLGDVMNRNDIIEIKEKSLVDKLVKDEIVKIVEDKKPQTKASKTKKVVEEKNV